MTPPISTDLPAFDKVGNLPVGDLFGSGASHYLIPATLPAIHERFVAQFPRSTRRPVIWDGWMRHRTAFASVGVPYATMVGGSFVTAKSEPGDVDLCIIMESTTVNQLATTAPASHRALQQLTATSHTKPTFLCDVYPLLVFPMSSPRFVKTPLQFNYWTRAFGIDRKGRQKSVLIVLEGGVL
jgi:hypothetical protein